MYYVVHHGRVVSAAIEFTPAPSARWSVGQIIHFSSAYAAFPEELDDAFLMDSAGAAWHIEILAVAPPRSADERSFSGVTVRLLRSLRAHEDTVAKARDYGREVAHFRRHQHQGAA